MQSKNKEQVAHPDHYQVEDKTYEPYKVIQAWEANFNIGSALKYLARYQKKWNPIEDLQKAKQYIDFEIDRLTNKNHVPILWQKPILNTSLPQKGKVVTPNLCKECEDYECEYDKGCSCNTSGDCCDDKYQCLNNFDNDCKPTNIPPKSENKPVECTEKSISDMVKLIDDAADAVKSNKMSPSDALIKVLMLDKNEADSIMSEKNNIVKMTEKIIDAVTNKFKTADNKVTIHEANPKTKDIWW
jgi:hypothetical protein